jgi:hypothetical protein
VPPHVISQMLRAAIDLPLTADVERLRIHDERATGTVAARSAERAHVDAIRPAVNRVRRRIAGAIRKLLGLDDLHDLRLPGIRLRVQDVNTRGVDSRHDEVAALHVRMRRIRAQARAAGVPAEVMQLVARVGHVGLPDEPAVALRGWIEVNNTDRVGFALASWIDQRHVGQRFRPGLHRHPGRWTKGRIRCEKGHRLLRLRPPN